MSMVDEYPYDDEVMHRDFEREQYETADEEDRRENELA